MKVTEDIVRKTHGCKKTVDIENLCIYGTTKNPEPVDNATVREAIVRVKNTADSALTSLSLGNCPSSFLWDIVRKCEAALSAPPRNCDLYATKSEMQAAFINWYNETFGLNGSVYAVDTFDLKHDVDGILRDYIKWLFASAAEQEVKASKLDGKESKESKGGK